MRLSYVEYGDGPALIILHGLFGSCRSRKPIAFISEPFELRCQALVMVMQPANLGKLEHCRSASNSVFGIHYTLFAQISRLLTRRHRLPARADSGRESAKAALLWVEARNIAHGRLPVCRSSTVTCVPYFL